jgi:hypothetical protein
MDQSNEQVEPRQSSPIPLKPMNMVATVAICSGGWLVPGLAHIIIGKWIRGLIFAACVLTMFGLGLAMHGKLFEPQFAEPIDGLAFLANIGVGIAYWVASHLDLGVGAMNWPSYDYGTKFLCVAGLLNYLIILDAFDVAQGRKP